MSLSYATSFLQFLKHLNDSGLIGMTPKLWERFFTPRVIYEVLEHDVRLELLDGKGQRAIHYKRMKVRFLQNDVFAIQDHVWGDGELFADYKCSPGVVVDRYREGQGYRVLISLRETKQKGDIEEFHIERHIHKGFTAQSECFQSKVNHPMRQLNITVIFPRKCHPKRVMISDGNAAIKRLLEPEKMQSLLDGRQQLSWSPQRPKFNHSYTIHWEW